MSNNRGWTSETTTLLTGCQIIGGRGYRMDEQSLLFLLRVEITEITTSESLLYWVQWFSTGYCHQQFCQISDWHDREWLCHIDSLKVSLNPKQWTMSTNVMKRGLLSTCAHRHYIGHFHPPNNAAHLSFSSILSLLLFNRLWWDSHFSCWVMNNISVNAHGDNPLQMLYSGPL